MNLLPKYKFTFPLLFFASFVYGQKAIFKEIKLRAKTEFFDPKDHYATIFYPIISTNNPNVSKLINDEIKVQILNADKENPDVLKNLNALRNDGLTDLSYEVTFNKNYVLSFSIYTQESGGSHLVDNTTYFNFDLKTGKQLSLSDLIVQSKINSFQRQGSSDKLDSLNKHKKEELNLFLQNEVDSLTYKWVIEEINANCTTQLDLKDFLLSNTYIEIVDRCQFPYAIRSQEPYYHLRYSFKSVQPILSSEFWKRLSK